MPKYTAFKVAGYYLYFTMACTIECMHVHASDTKLTESGSAKLFVKPDGDTIVTRQGTVSESDMNKIRKYIKLNYITMFEMWSKRLLWREQIKTRASASAMREARWGNFINQPGSNPHTSRRSNSNFLSWRPELSGRCL